MFEQRNEKGEFFGIQRLMLEFQICDSEDPNEIFTLLDILKSNCPIENESSITVLLACTCVATKRTEKKTNNSEYLDIDSSSLFGFFYVILSPIDRRNRPLPNTQSD